MGAGTAEQKLSTGEQAISLRTPFGRGVTSWVGTCPGKDESAEQNHSSHDIRFIRVNCWFSPTIVAGFPQRLAKGRVIG